MKLFARLLVVGWSGDATNNDAVCAVTLLVWWERRSLGMRARLVLGEKVVVGKLGHVGFATDKTAEQNLKHTLGHEDLVVLGSAFQVEQLHADGLCRKHTQQVLGRNAVLGDETLENVQPLGRDHKDAALLEHLRTEVGRTLDQVRLEEMLAHAPCHFTRHGERGRRGRGHDARGVLWVCGTVRLGELERRQVLTCFVAVMGVSTGQRRCLPPVDKGRGERAPGRRRGTTKGVIAALPCAMAPSRAP